MSELPSPVSGTAPDTLDPHRKHIGPLEKECPVWAAINVLRGRWKPSILCEIVKQPQRYSDIRKALPHISAQTLTVQLRELEADGLVVRDVYAEVPVRVEYRLTPLAESLSEVMDELEQWGARYLQERAGSGH
ncbi:winged helix-turn-helix transcriptional regulator [Gilvimarinus algae]|uniref:Helix-turn-helix domain-containing protein n=1 Tax=Gilvimarinus algae TaxID=3058037 RepID=A0ABT8TGE9_9GAMM|nr:helix-turn-helix domain-containing protein [Gilvimarinus sp. SDUM040014]MDO3383161.1 helix-turn-helix domain-containing protein [Gilvimarinus sp. SDUM040014]